MKTIFGPVPSRRLGRSLGIDVIPAKTCSYDCIYCESGPTTHLTIDRRSFVPVEKVLADLHQYFRQYPQGADVLTFSSAGEPTLYEPLGELVGAIKKQFPAYPLVMLTNGSLFWQPQVRRDLLAVDRVVPSLDALTPKVFQRLNRPHPELDLDRILEGLEAFARDYSGQLHMEVMLVAGFNDSAEELRAIARVFDRLQPAEVELNTVVRPPARPDTLGVCAADMERAVTFFPAGRAKIIGQFKAHCNAGSGADLAARILALVRRRPCTVPEMAASLGVDPSELHKILHALEAKGRLVRSVFGDQEYCCQASSRSV